MYKVKVISEIEVAFLSVSAKVRYWEDSVVDGVEDIDGDLIPCRNVDSEIWTPIIDLEAGKIINWNEDKDNIGRTAEIHYKVCDAGMYQLWSKDNTTIVEIDGYVPNMLSPKENGYGDYIIMDIDEFGFIKSWSVDLDEFEPQLED
jgi:hypothetical protein